MSAPLDCPGIECWQALFDDRLTPDQRERYERHLETCAACQERLDRAEEYRDALLGLFRQIGDPTIAPADPTLSHVLERLYETKSPEPTPPVEPADLYFLQPTDRPDLLGTLGPYEVQEVIGQGGMGVVLKAFEPALHRLVAIKVMAAAVAGSATARRRFTREAQAAAAVCHDHIVTVHGVHEANGLPYLVMQYIAGESLQARIDRTGPLEVEEVVRIGLQTAAGLAAAHAQGLIHRDIKPANLLLENGLARVKITDFGLARMVDDVQLTQNGAVTGTPEYMAPEQARGEPVDFRADLFSLGSVLYTMCTGTPPFHGASALAVLRQVNDQPPPSIRSLNPDVPAWLEALITRLMAKDPAERFQSAAEVATLLEGYLAHLRQPATVAAPVFFGRQGDKETRRQGDGEAGRRRRLLYLLLVSLSPCLLVWLLLGLNGAKPNESAASVRLLKGHQGPVHNVRFTSDGRLVSGSGWPQGDRTVRIWDPADGREVSQIPTPAQVHALDLSPDGRSALVGLGNGQVLYLNLETKQVIQSLHGHSGSVGWVAFAPDGSHAFSTAADGTARMWNLADGQEVAQFRVEGQRARGGAVFPDGRRLLTGDSGGLLQIWDVATHAEIKRFNMAGGEFIDSLILSPDGRQAVIVGAGGAHLYDLETGREVRQFQAEQEEVHQAALSPDGRWLLTAGFDGGVRLWDFATGELVRELGRHNGFAFSAAFSPDGRLAASAGGGEKSGGDVVAGTDHDIRLWDLTSLMAERAAARTFRWVTALAIIFLGVALSLTGTWWYVRGSRRARRQSPDDSESNEPAEDTAPAQPNSFPRPGENAWRRPAGRLTRRLRLPLLTLLAAVGLTSGTMLAIILLRRPGRPPLDYYQDLRGSHLPAVPFRLIGQDASAVITPEAEGLRIAIPAHRKQIYAPVGVALDYHLAGDFEATATYELVAADPPPSGTGVGVALNVELKNDQKKFTRFGRFLLPKEGSIYLAESWNNHGGNARRTRYVPTVTAHGQLRLVRRGATLHYLVADGTDGDFHEIDQAEFGTAETGSVRFVINNNNSPAAVEARLVDFAIRSAVVNGRPRDWLVRIELLGLATTLAFFLMFWLVRGPGRRHEPDLSPAAPPTAPARRQPAAPLVSFTCAHCGRHLGAAESLAGKKVRCPQCGQAVLVPAAQADKPNGTSSPPGPTA